VSKDGDRKSENPDYAEKKGEKARARKHKVSWVRVFYLFLLFASVGIAIYVIEHYQ
jgi:hypothetical protein